MRIRTTIRRSLRGLRWPLQQTPLSGTSSPAESPSRSFLPRLYPCLRDEAGSNLVETALASTVFFVLLLGIFEFSLAFYTYHYVSSAARQGSRYAIVRGADCSMNLPSAPASFHCGATETNISDYVKGLGYPGINSPKYMTVTVNTFSHVLGTDASGNPHTTWTSCGEGTTCNAPGDQVQVTVTYNFPLSIPFWKQQSLGISSTSNMVYSQ